MRVASRRSLSATGSRSLPRSVICWRVRARCPSTTSLMAAARKTTKAMNLGQYPWMNGRSAMTGVSAIRTRVMMLGRVHMGPLPRSAERLDDQLRDGLEGVEDAFARDRHGLEVLGALDPLAVLLVHQELALVVRVGDGLLLGGVFDHPPGIERFLELGDGRRGGEGALV